MGIGGNMISLPKIPVKAITNVLIFFLFVKAIHNFRGLFRPFPGSRTGPSPFQKIVWKCIFMGGVTHSGASSAIELRLKKNPAQRIQCAGL